LAEDIPADRLRHDYEALPNSELAELLLILQHGTSLWARRTGTNFDRLRELAVAYKAESPGDSPLDRLMTRAALVQDVLRSTGAFSGEEGVRFPAE
jgi:hypothetical protein